MPYCTEDGCPLLESGKCLEQFEDVTTCPHYRKDDDSQISDEQPESLDNKENKELESKMVNVYTGFALQLSEVNSISFSAISRLVILAGMPNVGKSTFVLSLMHLFQTNQSFAGFVFSGSQTLLEFEEKSFDSKIESERESPVTSRTQVGPPKFLHLKVSKDDLAYSRDILLTDISGETFNALKDSTEECKKFFLAKRADHFVLFFDADALSSLSARASAKTDGMGILKSLIDAGSITPETHIQIIFSRWDLLQAKDNREIHLNYLKNIKQELLNRYGDKFKFSFVEVSSRPDVGSNLAFGHGIDKIFPLWIEKSLLDSYLPSSTNLEDINENLSQFLQYRM